MLKYLSRIIHFIIIATFVGGPFILKHREQLLILMWCYLLLITMWYLFNGCILNALDKGESGPNCKGEQPNAIILEKLSEILKIKIDTINEVAKLYPIIWSTIVVYKIL